MDIFIRTALFSFIKNMMQKDQGKTRKNNSTFLICFLRIYWKKCQNGGALKRKED
jgi:hypothetical protein